MPNKSIVIKDFYNDYKKNIEEDSCYDMSYSQYVKIICDLHQEMMHDLLEGYEIKFKCGVGSFFIAKNKVDYSERKNIPTDFKKSKELGKRILLLNEHTNGYIYKFYWSSKRSFERTYHKLFRFDAVRFRKRELCSLLKDGKKDYINIKHARI